MRRLQAALYRLPKPVIAAVNGVAVGGGCDLALAADPRIAGAAARFSEAYIKVGVCPDAGGSYLLPRLIGPTKAAEMIFTGRIINADEANQFGLLNALVEPEQLMPTALEWAACLAAGPTVAIGLAKENIRQDAVVSFEDMLSNEHRAARSAARRRTTARGRKRSSRSASRRFKGDTGRAAIGADQRPQVAEGACSGSPRSMSLTGSRHRAWTVRRLA